MESRSALAIGYMRFLPHVRIFTCGFGPGQSGCPSRSRPVTYPRREGPTRGKLGVNRWRAGVRLPGPEPLTVASMSKLVRWFPGFHAQRESLPGGGRTRLTIRKGYRRLGLGGKLPWEIG